MNLENSLWSPPTGAATSCRTLLRGSMLADVHHPTQLGPEPFDSVPEASASQSIIKGGRCVDALLLLFFILRW